jgi:hypothetical protein
LLIASDWPSSREDARPIAAVHEKRGESDISPSVPSWGGADLMLTLPFNYGELDRADALYESLGVIQGRAPEREDPRVSIVKVQGGHDPIPQEVKSRSSTAGVGLVVGTPAKVV